MAAASTVNGPKAEHNLDGNYLSANVKSELGSIGGSPAAQSEEDIYEDTGDLDFTEANRNVWLCRVPKFLFENWADLQGDDDEPIHIGTVRVEHDEKNKDNYKRVSLKLDGDMPQNKDVPKDYLVEVNNTHAENMFIFSEKDLPGYKSRRPEDFGPRSYLYEKTKAENRSREEKKKKWEPYSRRGLPKQTALAGAVKVEANLNPVENEEYRRMMHERAVGQIQKKHQAIELDAASSRTTTQMFKKDDDKGFIKINAPTRKKAQDNKATRMPENELLDLLVSKFTEWRYWTLINLKKVTNQPEAYLKQTLEKIAKQGRSGMLTNYWSLKTSEEGLDAELIRGHEGALRNAKDEVAPGMAGDDEDDDYGMDDEEDEEMEDVKIS